MSQLIDIVITKLNNQIHLLLFTHTHAYTKKQQQLSFSLNNLLSLLGSIKSSIPNNNNKIFKNI
jgi:hypothetical protein